MTTEVMSPGGTSAGNGKKKSRKKVILLGLAAVVLVALVFFAISWSKRGVVSVQTSKVGRQDVASIVTASGQIKPPPEDLANVNANSMGKIVELLVHEGDPVKKGQLLLRTEDVQQTAGVQGQQAAILTDEADFAANQANVDSTKAALNTAQANLAQAQVKLKQATDTYTRGQQLLKDQLLAPQDFETRLSDYEVAKATVQSSESQLAQARAQAQQAISNRDMSKARVSQANAQLRSYSNLLAQTIYSAPMNGVITSLPVHLGENVVPGIQNQVGSVLFQIADMSVVTAEVMVDETDVINIKLDQPAEVTIDAVPNKTFKGKVTEIGQSAVSRSTGQTATTSTTSNEEAKDFKVVVTLDSPPPGLRPGLSTTAKITTATRQNAVTVPIQALAIRTRRELEEKPKNSGGTAMAAENPQVSAKDKEKEKEEIQGLFVVQAGIAKFVPVETGIMGSTDVEITKGIQAGDEIVTGSYQVLRTLKSNTKVKIEKAPAPGAAPGASS
ncbi:MAG TPA: efflux RND transporter periplasmic adaptor subunit [Terriglobia bacterium]|nr:efflux RND transporter periplasmic adaptor subunit [Terriglobia bacterium]